jgi:hypothetical protein
METTPAVQEAHEAHEMHEMPQRQENSNGVEHHKRIESTATDDPEKKILPASETTPTAYLTGWRLHCTTLGIVLALFLVNMEISIIGTSLVDITNDLQGFSETSWIVSGYLVTYMGNVTLHRSRGIAKLTHVQVSISSGQSSVISSAARACSFSACSCLLYGLQVAVPHRRSTSSSSVALSRELAERAVTLSPQF